MSNKPFELRVVPDQPQDYGLALYRMPARGENVEWLGRRLATGRQRPWHADAGRDGPDSRDDQASRLPAVRSFAKPQDAVPA